LAPWNSRRRRRSNWGRSGSVWQSPIKSPYHDGRKRAKTPENQGGSRKSCARLRGSSGKSGLKLVGYAIYFTKRDFEAALQEQQEELVDYATDAASFAAIKLVDFLGRVESQGIPWPPAWETSPGAGYPEPGQPLKNIPEADRKLLRVVMSVKDRYPKQEPEADREQGEALRAIREKLR
jgi:hypothetical protein